MHTHPADNNASDSAALPPQHNPEADSSSEHYRDLFQFAPVGYVISNSVGTIEEANCYAARLLNISPSELVNMPLATFITLAQRHTFRKHLVEIAQAPTERTWNTVFTPRNRPPFWGQLQLMPVLRGTEVTQVRWLIRDITAQKETELALEGDRLRLQVLSHRLVEAQETERRHMARELHDQIGQLLTGLKLSLENTRAHGLEISPGIDEAIQITNQLMTEVRSLSLQLRPPMLDSMGLIATVRWHIEQFSAQTKVEVRFTWTDLERRYPPRIELTAYRIIQEALTNIARHARVSEAAVSITADADTLYIDIEDSGRGFDEAVQAQADRISKSSGLVGMQERVALIGGQFNISSQPGRGTHISVQLHLGHFE